jgi:Holliday junction resolvase-like predicted endonuclease
MLTENEVIRLTCQKLITMGYEIVQSLHTTQRGVDIIASKDGHMLLIEAKGATSATEGTNRYGIEFSNNQVKHHVAMALYAIAKLMTINAEETSIFCIALPNNESHINAVNAIEKAIKRLDIKLIWVKENGEVNIPISL